MGTQPDVRPGAELVIAATLRPTAVATLGVFAYVAGTAFCLHAPVIAPDELGYLSEAWALAGWGRALVAKVGSYPLGYPLILAPLGALLRQPHALYRGTLLVNAALLASLVPCVQAILQRLRFSRREALIAGVLVATHPSLVTFAHLVFSENLFVPLQALAMLGLLVLIEEGSTWAAITFGVALAMSPFVRVIGIATTIAGTTVLAVLLRERAMRGRVALTAAAALVTAAFELAARQALPDLHVYGGVPAADVLATAVSAPLSLVRAACGQLVSISLSTGLLFPVLLVGAARLLPRAVARRTHLEAAEWSIVFAGLAAAGTFAISVAFMHAQPRADHAIYARYNEGLLAIVVCGGLYLLRAGVSRRLVGWPAVVGLTLVACGARSIAHGALEVVNVAALFVPLHVLGMRNLPVITLVLAAAAVAIGRGVRAGRTAAMVVVLLLHVAGGTALLLRYQIPGAELRATQAQFLSGLDPLVPQVAFDAGAQDDWTRSQARYAFPRAVFVSDGASDAELRLAPKDATAPVGYVAAALQQRGPLVAWMREDVWPRTGLGRALRLPPTLLTDAHVNVEVEGLEARGARVTLRARVVNLGEDFLPDASVFAQSRWPRHPVRLALRFADVLGASLGDERIDLAGPIRPGASGSVTGTVPLPVAATSVVIVLVQEGGGDVGAARRYEIQREATRQGP